jgi:putative transposase
MVFHVLNRGVGRRDLFTKHGDFLALERVVEETLRTRPMRLCAYCLMSNHWHLVVWPERDGDLPAFMQQLTNTHVKRWKEHRREIGYGHLYQGRYKRPFGHPEWVLATAQQLGLEWTLRPRGRPKKQP